MLRNMMKIRRGLSTMTLGGKTRSVMLKIYLMWKLTQSILELEQVELEPVELVMVIMRMRAMKKMGTMLRSIIGTTMIMLGLKLGLRIRKDLKCR
jgi:hypothetical protein